MDLLLVFIFDLLWICVVRPLIHILYAPKVFPRRTYQCRLAFPNHMECILPIKMQEKIGQDVTGETYA